MRVPGDSMTLKLAKGVNMEFMRVPAGDFLMGSDPEKDSDAYGDEQPQHRVHLDEYWMGKYPVTNAQYRACAVATDRENPGHWENGQIPTGKETHPVVNVTWHDAVAFCAWAGQVAKVDIRLPTEAQWEKAARGTDGRLYSWGNENPDGKRCNFYMEHTTPVGQYSPMGDSPYGCADMIGNVDEWTGSLGGKGFGELFFGYPYEARDGREDLKAADDIGRVLRGGFFSSEAKYVRCAFRLWYCANFRFRTIGFRALVASNNSGL
jgi:formylglycine-generating enzyme required for sulfatase activity